MDNKANDGETTSEATLFAEYPQAVRYIGILCEASSSRQARHDALIQLRTIWDKYLESPTLLDPYLERMVSTLAKSARHYMEPANTRENCPSLLNSHEAHVLSALYALAKVRGRKRIQRFLPHEARDVEPILQSLKHHNNILSKNATQHQPGDCDVPPWQSVYTLWLWLGKLSLVPFDCNIILDSNKQQGSIMMASLVTLAKEHLSHAGPTRETAASCLASWLSRPDLDGTELAGFVQWSKKELFEGNPRNSTFLQMGILQTLVAIVKNCSNRSLVLERMQVLWEPLLLQAEESIHNVALRKLLTKWFARMACLHLPPRIASWRYQRGKRSLSENLSVTCTGKTKAAGSTSTNSNNLNTHDAPSKQDNDELFHVPDQVEDAMGIMILSLSDSATVVRWSAAKGVGRITERLPSLCAHDILDALLELFQNQERDHAWHGACLALAELARRGLLLPSRLQDVVPVIVKAIQYDVRRGHTSVGSHVRDAACYTYWAFARAYAPSVLKPYIPRLSESIILAFLFDREVNCRRAASAAFQECVGRQGADNFKHGISILTTADYFTLGNRNDAYTSIAQHVAQFMEYREPIIRHLYCVKLYHWDPNIRSLASKSLNGLSELDVDYMANAVVPFLLPRCTNDTLFVRHGAVLGLAEVVLALGTYNGDQSNESALLSESNRLAIAELVPKMEKARLYRGRGGEIMRSAVCRLIECTCLSRMSLSVKQQVRLLDSIDSCLKHPNEDIQESASNALHALMRSYFPVGEKGPSDRLQKRVVDKYIDTLRKDDNPAATRGFALAIGSLPRKVLAPSSSILSSVIGCLCEAARFDAKIGGEGDAETRRNSIISLSRICDTVGIGPPSRPQPSPVVGMNRQQVSAVFEAFFLGCQDYNMDRRGDVGSWSRSAAMSGLGVLTKLAVKASNNSCSGHEKDHIPYIDRLTSVKVIGALLKQLSEKLDSVRSHAGQCLEQLINDEDLPVSSIPHRPFLIEALDLQNGQEAKQTNWSSAASTFPMVTKLCDIDDYFPDIVAGMVISVGGLTESVTKQASAALMRWISRAKAEGDASRVAKLGDVLLDLFKCHQRDPRVTLPLLKTLDTLLSHGMLDELASDQSSPFAGTLVACLKTEAQNCSDVHRLLAITSVSMSMLGSRQDKLVLEEILPFVFIMLGHRFPRVRRFTADQLYMHLLEDVLIVSDIQDVEGTMELLLNTPWDADLDIGMIRQTRDKAAGLIGVRVPNCKKTTGTISKKQAMIVDEYESYASLVKDVSR